MYHLMIQVTLQRLLFEKKKGKQQRTSWKGKKNNFLRDFYLPRSFTTSEYSNNQFEEVGCFIPRKEKEERNNSYIFEQLLVQLLFKYRSSFN